jgi:hypothetical protein
MRLFIVLLLANFSALGQIIPTAKLFDLYENHLTDANYIHNTVKAAGFRVSVLGGNRVTYIHPEMERGARMFDGDICILSILLKETEAPLINGFWQAMVSSQYRAKNLRITPFSEKGKTWLGLNIFQLKQLSP